MRWKLGPLLVLLMLASPHVVKAGDACEREKAYLEQVAALRRQRQEKASLIPGVNSRIQEIRTRIRDFRSQSAWASSQEECRRMRQELAGYLEERRAIYTDLRLMRDTLQQISRERTEAHRACMRSKRSSKSPRPRPTPTRASG
jgi:predicted  nucleic acid-binding Zn-ribbon protein